MRFLNLVYPVSVLALVGGLGYLGYATESTWRPWLQGTGDEAKKPADAHGELDQIELSAQAQQNLKLKVASVPLTTFQRTLRVPGSIQERPGGCGFVVTAPVAGIVKKISAQRGELVKPGAPLFTLHILSEPLMTAQTGLYKAQRELQITQEEKKRLIDFQSAISVAKMIEVENQLKRISAMIDGFVQDLAIRGLTKAEIQAVGEGKFLTETIVRAPAHVHAEPLPGQAESTKPSATNPHRDIEAFEVEDLKVLTGEHVQAGQAIGHLADHQVLAIEGKLFAGDVPLVRKAAAEGLAVEVDFPVDDKHQWPTQAQRLQIHYFANKIDADSQTLGFYLLLINQHQDYQRDDKNYRVWRFRPGQRVSLRFAVEEFKDVLVLPAGAVVREGGEAFVFCENGKHFKRVPVRVLYSDSEWVVLPNDGTFAPSERLVHNAAAALNRVLKAKAQEGGGGHTHDH